MSQHPAQTKAAALAMYAAGRSMRDVARAHGVAESTICSWVNAAGIGRTHQAAQRARQTRIANEDGYYGGWFLRGGIKVPLLPERRSA